MAISIQVGDLVEFRSAHKILKFKAVWNEIGFVTQIYKAEKGKNRGKEMARVYFTHSAIVAKFGKKNLGRTEKKRETTILLKRLKKVRGRNV